jgi:hypothetical protein
LPVIVAGLEQDHTHARFGKTRGDRPTAGSGADNGVVTDNYVIGEHAACQNG